MYYTTGVSLLVCCTYTYVFIHANALENTHTRAPGFINVACKVHLGTVRPPSNGMESTCLVLMACELFSEDFACDPAAV